MDLYGIIKNLENGKRWVMPAIPEHIPHGDMPGDKVEIKTVHIERANTIFPLLLSCLSETLEKSGIQKTVVSVCGGSGVGKSGIASLLTYFFNQLGVGCYTLSGDNYPHRIPKYNDAERLHLFRESAIRSMIQEGIFSEERFRVIQEFQRMEDDANQAHIQEYPWFASYLRGGRDGLRNYLGTERELWFQELETILSDFKSGKPEVWLRRLGRDETELWYSKIDCSKIQIMIVEWTHGNSDYFQGVDIPILLNSTPQETLVYRMARNRDGAIDSPFTTMVLELEQELLHSQAHKAQIILSKNGELLSYEELKRQQEECSGGCHGT